MANCCLFPATAGSVLRASTSLELGDLFAWLEEWMLLLGRIHHRQLCIHLFDVFPCPADACDLNPAITIHQIRSRDVRQLVGVRNDVLSRIVDGDRKSYPILLYECLRLTCVVLRYPEDGGSFGFVKLRHSLEVRKSVLACRTAHFEESEHNWSSLHQFGKNHRLSRRGLQSELLSLRTVRKRHLQELLCNESNYSILWKDT